MDSSRCVCCLFMLLVSCGGSAPARPPPQATSPHASVGANSEARPAVLFASPDGLASLDLGYLRSLASRGVELDWTASLADIDEARLSPFDVLVLFATPETLAISRGEAPDPGRREAFIALVEQFVRSGGGLMLMPEETNLHRQRLADLYERWGATIPAERIVETDANRIGALPNTSYVIPLAWTDQVAPGPLTANVRAIWYPNHPAFLGATTLPLIVDGNWQVVVRASRTAVTHPLVVSPSADAAPGLVQRPESEPAPPLLAVRSLDAGRVALVSIWPQFTFGAGTKLIYGGTVLEHGLRGRPSDVGVLLENTLKWLAASPSRRKASPRWVTNRDKLELTRNRSDADQFRIPSPGPDPVSLKAMPKLRAFRGLIGAQTRVRDTTISVDDYAQVARREGLDFVVFLEDFGRTTPEQLSDLASRCEELSAPDLLLLPGLSIRNNIGNRMFLFGPSPTWPPDWLLNGRSRTLQIQQESGDNFPGFATSFGTWLMRNYGHEALGQVGYFDFADSPRGMRPVDLRLYGGLGVRYLRDNRLVEDVTSEYLATAAGTMSPAPYAVHEVSSLAAFARAAREQIGLTYVTANSLVRNDTDGVLKSGLRWSTQYEATYSFVSDGPRVLSFPQTNRIFTFGAEGFSPERSLIRAAVEFESASGIRQIELYDGTDLYRRMTLLDSTTHVESLVLDGSVQRNIVAIVRDRDGKTAVSSPLRAWAEGSLAPVFCGDRTNDCVRMRLARGPWSLPLVDQPAPTTFESGRTWDGGPLAFVSSIGAQNTLPWFVTAEGQQVSTERLVSKPVLEFSDEGALSVNSIRDGRIYDDRLIQVINSWNTFGPIAKEKAELHHVQRYRQWQRATSGPAPFTFGANGSFEGGVASLFSQTLNFSRPQSIDMLGLAKLDRVPGSHLVLLAKGKEATSYSEWSAAMGEVVVRPGDAFAVFGGEPLNANIFVNRGDALLLRADTQRLYVWAKLEPKTFRANEMYHFEVAAIALPRGVATTAEQIVAFLKYVMDPNGLIISRGTRINSPGILEIEQAAGAIELSVPQTDSHKFIPVRVAGLNRRWSSGLFQAEGYTAGFYGSGRNRYRSLGTDRDGFAYIPLFTSLANYHVVAGHPVVADARGKDLFIEVVCLGGTPLRWRVAVNNPTRRTLTTLLRCAMPLPGLSLGAQTITLKGGEYRVLL